VTAPLCTACGRAGTCSACRARPRDPFLELGDSPAPFRALWQPAAPLPLSQDESASQAFRSREDARTVVAQVRANARTAAVEAALGPRSAELQAAVRDGTAATAPPPAGKAPPPKKAGGSKTPAPKQAPAADDPADGAEEGGPAAAAGSNEARTCPVCAHTVQVAAAGRVAGELADHINGQHPGTIIAQPTLRRLRLAQCPVCTLVGPNRSFGRHRCLAELDDVDQPLHPGRAAPPPRIALCRVDKMNITVPDGYTRVREIPKGLDDVWLAAARRVFLAFLRNPTPATLAAVMELPTRVLIAPKGPSRRRKQFLRRALWDAAGDGDGATVARPPDPPDEPPARTDAQRTRAAVDRLTKAGAFSKAWTRLQSAGVASDDVAIDAAVAAMFPIRHEDLPAAEVTPCIPSAHEVRERLRAAPRAAAPGPSGWTRELLLPLLVEETMVTAIASVLAHLSVGCPRQLTDGLVTPLTKKDTPPAADGTPAQQPTVPGIRPTVAVDCWLKLLGSVCVKRALAQINAKCHGQFGLRSAEEAIRAIRSLHAERGGGIVTVDARNAYNSICRSAIWAQLRTVPEFAALLPAATIELFAQSTLFCRGRQLPTRATTGLLQGSTVAPALFCIGVQPLLDELRSRHPTVSVVAYLDDITLVGSDEALGQATVTLRRLLAAVGLEVNPGKSWAWRAPSVVQLCRFKESPPNDGIKVLGAWIGSEQAATAHAKQVADDTVAQLEKAKILTKHAAVCLLRFEAPAKVVFLLRTQPPETTAAAATLVDAAVKDLVLHTFGELSANQWLLLSLPLRLGGFGIRPSLRVAPFAFSSTEKGQQKTRTAQVEELLFAGLPADIRRLAREARFAATFDPTHGLLGDEAFVAAVRHRLGDVPWAMQSHHVSKTDRHDRVKNLLASLLRDNGHTVRCEPRMFHTGGARADIALYSASGAKGVVVDVTIVLAHDADYTTVLQRAVAEKHRSYARLAEQCGHAFVAFAMTTRGAVCEEGWQLLAAHLDAPRAALSRLQRCLAEGNACLLRAQLE